MFPKVRVDLLGRTVVGDGTDGNVVVKTWRLCLLVGYKHTQATLYRLILLLLLPNVPSGGAVMVREQPRHPVHECDVRDGEAQLARHSLVHRLSLYTGWRRRRLF